MNDYHSNDIQILQTLKKIRQTNEQIAYHSRFNKPDSLALKQLHDYKADLVRQLEELLAELNLELPAVA